MGGQHDATTWQELLGQLIADPQERQRIEALAHVRPITLQRWVNGTSRPRDENIRTLLTILPKDIYPAFLRLVVIDFPHLRQEDLAISQIHQEVPSEFYARILAAFAFAPQPMCHQTIQDFLLRQAVAQLDPERHGMALSVVGCMPPDCEGKVRSLHEIGGLGTHPWKHDLEQKKFFLGSESLIGSALTKGQIRVVNSRKEMTFFPAHWTEYEMSAAAVPIVHHARVAGGLVASSAIETFFTDAHIAVLEQYAYLAGLLFEEEECYSFEDLELWMMPDYLQQSAFFQDFDQRISRKFAEQRLVPMSIQKIRQQVWQDLEQELLQSFLPHTE